VPRKKPDKKAATRVMLANVLDYVIANDRTRPYGIDEPNVFGEKPIAGKKWQTPKEYALELCRQLEIKPRR
jgi:hypothetical protein